MRLHDFQKSHKSVRTLQVKPGTVGASKAFGRGVSKAYSKAFSKGASKAVNKAFSKVRLWVERTLRVEGVVFTTSYVRRP